MLAALLIVVPGLLVAAGARSVCDPGPCPAHPIGPYGQAVEDRFTFAHQALTGDGGITVRLTSMTGIITYPPPGHDRIVTGLVPWAKAGLMIKESVRQGSPYAAVMLTGSHGTRMQYNFTEDMGGRTGTSPRWLRLTRSGERITGYESPDGEQWTTIGTATLPGLPATVRIGLFAASPGDMTVDRSKPGGAVQVRFTQASATFDHVSLQGGWSTDEVGGEGVQTDWERSHRANGLVESGDTLTVTGTGDIAPRFDAPRIETTLIGTFAALIVIVVMGVRTREPLKLAAQAFVTGTIAACVEPVGTAILRGNGTQVLPVSLLTEARVIIGTGVLLAASAVLAAGVGALLRRKFMAATVVFALLILPFLLAFAGILPDAVTAWLFRITPAAGFAIQQSIPEYAHVIGYYVPTQGFYPLPPLAGLAVLAAYAAAAFSSARSRSRSGR
ncbi:hypothetical protein Aph01nite_35310 [Acrocarpospora phusangensis]|uniref:DUF1349 domain-containing protein n=2 Tax=Acrocarpospora phusangensis TaxID=1070424 RepID=A0A919QBZ8_9ACTN|nr:hypothetical protein Aph01nite_35310 [Acrocarpospora phusangensis]